MIVAAPGTSLTINHPSRKPATQNVTATLYDKSTRELVIKNVPATWDDGIIQLTITGLNLKNTKTYYLTVMDQDETKNLFNTNVLITDQTDLQDYTVDENENIYPPQQNNEFITP